MKYEREKSWAQKEVETILIAFDKLQVKQQQVVKAKRAYGWPNVKNSDGPVKDWRELFWGFLSVVSGIYGSWN